MKLSPNLNTFIFGLVILFSGIILIPKVHAGNLTAPLSPPLSINSYFDHSQPGFVGGIPTINNNITIFTGTTTTSANGVCGYLFGQAVAYYAGPGGSGSCVWYEGHDGIDFQATSGMPVLAAASGIATAATWDNCGGNYVRLWHSKLGYSTRYFHLSKSLIATSTVVNQLQQIATSGGTGACTTGPHLHFDIRNAQKGGQPIDPYGWSGSGSDPWAYDQGYLWTTNPPSLTVPYTPVSGTLTQNTTWTASGSPYLVTNFLTINPGVTLKINPGVVVKFNPGTYINVNGTLNASTTYPGGHNGTIEFPGSNSKIYFTSYKDDSVGGDTNGDGNATVPKSGNYKGIYFYAGSSGIFDNAVVRYGGSPGTCCPSDYGVIKNLGGNVSIHNSTFKYNRDAVYNYYSYYPGATTIDSSLITDSDNYGVYVAANYATSSVITVTNTGFGNNLGGDGYFSARVNFTNSGNFTVGTTTRGFRFAGMGYDNQTWSPGIPFYIIGSYVMNASASLTILPGTIVKFDFGESLGIYGNLDVQGDTFNPVYFTSSRDDSVGGDTNGDGTTTAPAIKDYEGIYFWQGSTGVIDNAIVRYGGDPTCCPGYYGAIINVGGNVIVKNSVVEYNRDGIYLGIYPASLTLDNSVVRDNYNFGVYANNSFMTTSSMLAITNTLFQNNYVSDAYIYGDVEFINSGNFSTGSTTGFVMHGSQSKSQAWNPGIPFVIDGGSTFGFGIDAGATLTVNPGSILKFKVNSQMDVYGNLVAVGTSTNKVYFTSLKDDAIGGDTNGDGTATMPAPSDYGGFYFYASSTGYFDNAVLRYGGYPAWFNIYGVIKGYGGLVNITRTKIYSNSYGTFQMGGNPINAFNISQSSVYGNTGYGVHNYSSATTTAVNNWWGDPSGPYHPTMNPNGKGDKVSNNVNFTPWLTFDPN